MKKNLLILVVFFLISGITFIGLKGIEKESASIEGGYITIPFKLYFNEIFFQASVNQSKPLWIILDSGASEFVINEKSARELNLPLGDIIDQGYSGIGENRIFEKELNNISLTINNVDIPIENSVYAWSFDTIEKVLGHRLDAVCGRQLFEEYIIEIDYSKNLIKLHDPAKYAYKGNGTIVPIFIDGVPYMKATVILSDNKKIEGFFMIDTGMHGALSFTSKFTSENNLDKGIKTIKNIGVGGGGISENQIGRIKAIILGGYKIDDPIASLSKDTRGGMARSDIAGLIGTEILKKFKVIFDYSNSRLILEPSDILPDPIKWDMAGLFLYTTESFDTIMVYKVLPDSPAELSGIKEGDQIAFIDGIKSNTFSIDEISKMFKIENKQYRLGIIRGGKNLEVKMNTKRMI